MPSILYEDNPQRSSNSRPMDFYKMPATKFYLKHYSNMLVLMAIQKSPKDFAEKMRAGKEIAMCQRKLDYWQKHPNFSSEEAANGCIALKKQWNQS